MTTHFFKYGKKKIEYSVIYQNRKTISLIVSPDKKVIVKAPESATVKDVDLKLKKKVGWILKQLNYFEQFQPLTPQRRYISGETHLYLGRQYRLKVKKSLNERVILKNGYLNVFVNNHYEKEQISKVLNRWYKERAELIFNEIYDRTKTEFQKRKLIPESFVLREMKKRWGSCTPSKKIILNTELIKTPKKCIEYVLVHEMCHLKYPNHSKSFYSLQSAFFPDWEYWKNKLEVIMS